MQSVLIVQYLLYILYIPTLYTYFIYFTLYKHQISSDISYKYTRTRRSPINADDGQKFQSLVALNVNPRSVYLPT